MGIRARVGRVPLSWRCALAGTTRERTRGQREVIAEGLSGRTATIEHPAGEGLNGLPYLLPCLHSHAPVDLLIIYLGTNDAYFLDPLMVALSVGRLVKVAQNSEAGPERRAPRLLVLCPPSFGEHDLGPSFTEICMQLDCELLDLDGVTAYSSIDGVHLDEAGHIAVAAAVETRVRQMLT